MCIYINICKEAIAPPGAAYTLGFLTVFHSHLELWKSLRSIGHVTCKLVMQDWQLE